MFKKLAECGEAFNTYANEIKAKFEPVDTTPDKRIGGFEYVAGSLRRDYEEWTAENEGYPFTHEDLSRVVEELDRETAPGITNMSVFTLSYKQAQQDAARELRQNLYKDSGFARNLDRQWSGEPERPAGTPQFGDTMGG